MGAGHESFEFFHSLADVDSKIGVNVIVVLDGIWRTGLAFDHVRIVGAYALAAVVGPCGMLDHSGVPHVGGSKFLDA